MGVFGGWRGWYGDLGLCFINLWGQGKRVLPFPGFMVENIILCFVRIVWSCIQLMGVTLEVVVSIVKKSWNGFPIKMLNGYSFLGKWH